MWNLIFIDQVEQDEQVHKANVFVYINRIKYVIFDA